MSDKKYITAKPCRHCGCEHFSIILMEDGTEVLTCWICGVERRTPKKDLK